MTVPRPNLPRALLGDARSMGNIHSLVPRPCTFVACSTKFALREFRTASDERAGPGNEAILYIYYLYITYLSVFARVCSIGSEARA